MGWGGIKNLPPGFDAFGGKQPPPSIVDLAIRGKLPGLGPGREQLFSDLRRNLLHQDFLRFFDSSLLCAGILFEIEDGKYRADTLKDVVEPALAVAVEQLEAIKADVVRSRGAKRPMLYDPVPSMAELRRRAVAIAVTYPEAAGAKEFEARSQAIIDEVRSTGPATPS